MHGNFFFFFGGGRGRGRTKITRKILLQKNMLMIRSTILSFVFAYFTIWLWRFGNSHCVKIVQIRRYFWSIFSCIRTEYRKIQTRNNSVFGHFSRSVIGIELLKEYKSIVNGLIKTISDKTSHKLHITKTLKKDFFTNILLQDIKTYTMLFVKALGHN